MTIQFAIQIEKDRENNGENREGQRSKLENDNYLVILKMLKMVIGEWCYWATCKPCSTHKKTKLNEPKQKST